MLYRFYLLDAFGIRFISETRDEDWLVLYDGERVSLKIAGREELCQVVYASTVDRVHNPAAVDDDDHLAQTILVRVLNPDLTVR